MPLHVNPTDRAAGYGQAQADILAPDAFETALAEISTWPGYQPTPLLSLPDVARDLGIGMLHYKDEGRRFGLKSFKALGGAYAVLRLLQGEVERRTAHRPGARELAGGEHRPLTENLTVTCATDGNHGRSVAWGAQSFGCACVIFVHATVSQARCDAIAAYGADIARVDGTYDDAVREAAAVADREGWTVVSDTSYDGYMDVPRDVMAGYSVMAAEAMWQISEAPTHVFLQGGVGALAASVVALDWAQLGAKRPVHVVVEPERADCLYQSALAGKPTPASGDLDTVMAGLSCGEVSLLAWAMLKDGAEAFMTVDDDAAKAMMRRLADGATPVVAGESAVAGLAGLAEVMSDAGLTRALGLSTVSRVLIYGSEGDTDPALYAEIVGRSAAEVRAA
ncbi:MAG: diaminopropionate ammonia-lyase [Alphaproteobacteria bacterium]